ncbi:MAG: hypothetical protein WBA22_01485 [Candidatus Methanofastidiosia archaeon]
MKTPDGNQRCQEELSNSTYSPSSHENSMHFTYNVLPFCVFYLLGKEITEVIIFGIPDFLNVAVWILILAALLYLWKRSGEKYVMYCRN